MKKAGAVVFAAAGLMMLGSPAFADPWHGVDDYFPGANQFRPTQQESGGHDQMGIVNFGHDADVLSQISALCNLDVNVLAIPILQGNEDEGVQVCAASDDDSEFEETVVVDEDDDEDD
jgi:hypothetical protein